MVNVKMTFMMFCIIYCSIPLYICLLFFLKHVPLVEFVYLVFTHVPGESYRRRLRSLLLCLCDVFQALLLILGEMELRVGSNIMIHFLSILLFLIWHMSLYFIHC